MAPAAAGWRCLSGCINPVLAPSTNEAAIRLLNRHGIEVVVAAGEACCGSLVHHMGREEQALAQARNNIDAWTREIEGAGLDAILITVSGCGTTVKDYGFMLRSDPAYAAKAARISALAKDVTEYLATLDLPAGAAPRPLTVAYHSACSLQHGQKVTQAPKELLCKFGFVVKDVPEGHLCCGSAGTYNILQPALAERLRDRKIANIERLQPDVIAAGNIGCITQIAAGTAIPVVHTVELLDWATGGPVPEGLEEIGADAAPEHLALKRHNDATRTDWEDCHGKSEEAENQSEESKARRPRAQDEGEKGKRPVKKAVRKTKPAKCQGKETRCQETAPAKPKTYKILMMGAAYGSLLASKMLFGGHSIHHVCLPAEADLINAEGFRVRLPVRGRKDPVVLEFAKAARQGDRRRRGRRQPEGLRPDRPRHAGAAVPLARRARTARRGGEIARALHVDHEHAAAALREAHPRSRLRCAEAAYTDPTVWDNFDPA